MVRKLFAIISLLFVFTFSSFADLTKDDYKSLLLQSVTALTETTLLLEEANEKIISLEKQIIKSNSAQCEEKLEKSVDALKSSNETLEKAKFRIESDGVEIEDLRNNLQDCIDNMPEIEMFTLGGGYTYPGGAQIFFMFDIPKIPISIYTNANVLIVPIGLNFTIGVAYRF